MAGHELYLLSNAIVTLGGKYLLAQTQTGSKKKRTNTLISDQIAFVAREGLLGW